MIHLNSVSVYRPSLGIRKSLHPSRRIEVLRSITFSAQPGERIGILGQNGSGKTTLLRVLAGIFAPDSGIVQLEQATSAILDAGFGLEPSLSGRANAMSRMIISGVNKKKRLELLSDLETFVDLGAYYDEPISTYSAGMLTRLSFGLATALPQSALLIDEGFGTIDARFQVRAQARLNDFLRRTPTVIMASHNLDQLRAFCKRGLILENGGITLDTDINGAIEAYVSGTGYQ